MLEDHHVLIMKAGAGVTKRALLLPLVWVLKREIISICVVWNRAWAAVGVEHSAMVLPVNHANGDSTENGHMCNGRAEEGEWRLTPAP
jgi:hypothetical protein